MAATEDGKKRLDEAKQRKVEFKLREETELDTTHLTGQDRQVMSPDGVTMGEGATAGSARIGGGTGSGQTEEQRRAAVDEENERRLRSAVRESVRSGLPAESVPKSFGPEPAEAKKLEAADLQTRQARGQDRTRRARRPRRRGNKAAQAPKGGAEGRRGARVP